MPLTVPTHPVAVVPLKLWRPRWFDGVALVLGATTPDLFLAADGYGLTIHSHAWHAPLWWALPLSLVGARLVRWAAPAIAAHLPAAGPLALRDYGVLGAVRHSWPVTAVSALLGAITHIVWDAFTHPVPFPWLHHRSLFGLPLWDLLSMLSNVVGFVAGLALALHIGRRRLLIVWHGLPRPMPRRPAYFWSVAGGVAALGVALLPVQPARLPQDQAIRVLLIACLAPVAGAAAVRLRS
jgi:hypothetical protein